MGTAEVGDCDWINNNDDIHVIANAYWDLIYAKQMSVFCIHYLTEMLPEQSCELGTAIFFQVYR